MTNKKEKQSIIREQSLTYDDYARLDDGNRYELVDGKLEMMSPGPSVTHQMISAEMQFKINESCGNDYFVLNAPIDLILSQKEVRQPDLVLIHRSRLNILSKQGIIGTPDLVSEILSPSTLRRDKLDKLKVYAKFSIPEYWIIDPASGVLEQYILENGRFELHNLFQEDDTIHSTRLPCISFTMNEIRSRIPDIQ